MGKRKIRSKDGSIRVFIKDDKIFGKPLPKKTNLDFDEDSIIEVKGVKGYSPDWIKDAIKMETGKEASIGKKGDETLGYLKPIMNLDLYSKDENGKKIPIDGIGKAVVKVSYNKLRKSYNGTNPEDIHFFVLEEDPGKKEYTWLNIKNVDSVKVKIVKKRSRHNIYNIIFSFDILKWPIDDKWIATGP